MNNIRVLITIILFVILFLMISLNMTALKHIYSPTKYSRFITLPAYNVKPIYQDIWKNTNRSVTVVTAFFNLGKFPKGSISNVRSPDSYKSWMQVYKYLKNPLIIYTDSNEYIDFFTNLRKNSSSTKIIKFSRKDLWTFKILPNISKIYSKPGYPKHYPNTHIPEYTSMTHSKLTLVVEAMKANIFPSDYFCWIDLGYFRDIGRRKRDFYLEVPNDFNNLKVGVTRVYNVDLKKTSASSIILGNLNWIGGGLFLGKPDVLEKFESQYKNRVLFYLSKNLMNVEQHILYAMYTKEERKKNPITVEVQTYIPGTQSVISGDPWFYLGYLMYHEIQLPISKKNLSNMTPVLKKSVNNTPKWIKALDRS